MRLSKQQHLEEAERLLLIVSTLTDELDLNQPAQAARLQALEWQADTHLKLATSAEVPVTDLCGRALTGTANGCQDRDCLDRQGNGPNRRCDPLGTMSTGERW